MKTIERVQTGVRLERKTVKVLKALAEYLDLSMGDLLEGIVLHAFDGRSAFEPGILLQIARLKEIYGLDVEAVSASRRGGRTQPS